MCSIKISKFLLFIFNIAFFLLGAGVLAVGIFLVVDKNFLMDIIGNIPSSDNFDVDAVLNTTSFLENGAYMLIGAGSVIFVIAFCGLCGGIKESTCLLNMYSILVTIILLVQVTAGVLCYFYGTMVESYLLTWLTALVESKYSGAMFYNDVLYQSTDTTGVSDAIDFAQISMSCCGISNISDYDNAANWPGTYNYTSGGATVSITNATVPITCCKMNNPSAWPTDISSITFVDVADCLSTGSAASTNQDSCYSTVLSLLGQYSQYAIYVGIGIAAMEILGVLSACFLRQQVTKRDDRPRRRGRPHRDRSFDSRDDRYYRGSRY